MTEREERESALDEALEGIGRDDEMPESFGSSNNQNADYEEMVYGDTTSFYDKLNEQMGEIDLTDMQHEVMEYLIGSLDDDGLLRKDLNTISDELAIYHNIDVSEKKSKMCCTSCRRSTPPVSVRNLQECLLLQIDRKPDGRLKGLHETCDRRMFRRVYQETLGQDTESARTL